MANILVVEDEPNLALGLEDDLRLDGYEVEGARDGETAVLRALEHSFDLIILDVMLPRKDGFQVCRQLRQAGLQTPIILLTARTLESDKVLGLDLGADDYVTKPFSPRELRARVRAILRQRQSWLQEHFHFDQEVQVAADVQQRLFPQFRPPLTTLDYVGVCQPAQAISGDYYDFLDVAPGKLGLLVADVAGKGISAALLMASLHACIRTHAPLLSDRCSEVVAKANALLYEASNAERFATLFYAVYDDATRILTYVNAGHEPPLVLCDHGQAQPLGQRDEGQFRSPRTYLHLDSTVLPVGIFPALCVVQRSIQLTPGHWLLIFTDGITEALDKREEEFGRERLLKLIAGNSNRTAAEMRDAILAEVNNHRGGQPQSDDLTLIVAHVL